MKNVSWMIGLLCVTLLGAAPPPGHIDPDAPQLAEIGEGVVSIPANRLRLSIDGDRSPTDESRQRFADVLRSSGVSNVDIEKDVILGTILHPTHESVSRIAHRIAAKLPPDLLSALPSNFNGVLEVDSCTAALEKARTQAIAQAASRAASFVSSSGYDLGAPVHMTETDRATGCPGVGGPKLFSANDVGSYGPLNVDVKVTVSLTFALQTRNDS